jgi:hypothetical protein
VNSFLGRQPRFARTFYALGVVLYQLVVGDFSRAVTTDWAFLLLHLLFTILKVAAMKETGPQKSPLVETGPLLEESRTLYCALISGCLVVFQHLSASVINLSSGCRHDQPTPTFAAVDFVASILADASRSGIFLNARACPLTTVAWG